MAEPPAGNTRSRRILYVSRDSTIRCIGSRWRISGNSMLGAYCSKIRRGLDQCSRASDDSLRCIRLVSLLRLIKRAVGSSGIFTGHHQFSGCAYSLCTRFSGALCSSRLGIASTVVLEFWHLRPRWLGRNYHTLRDPGHRYGVVFRADLVAVQDEGHCDRSNRRHHLLVRGASNEKCTVASCVDYVTTVTAPRTTRLYLPLIEHGDEAMSTTIQTKLASLALAAALLLPGALAALNQAAQIVA